MIAFPDGETDSYWHDRDSGGWGSYVTDEVIPEVTKQFATDRNRVAIGGISMGGFGAFDAALSNPGRFCAVGGHSPALWQTGGETAAGAFDDAEDFKQNDVIEAAGSASRPFRGEPVWLDGGFADPFSPGIDAMAKALQSTGADVTVQHWPGGHEAAYWDRHWDEYLAFYARALAACRR